MTVLCHIGQRYSLTQRGTKFTYKQNKIGVTSLPSASSSRGPCRLERNVRWFDVYFDSEFRNADLEGNPDPFVPRRFLSE